MLYIYAISIHKGLEMEILYANGDSFVFGMECIADFSQDECNKELAFPKRIADELDCKTYINNSYNGATNEFIFRSTIFDLLELEKQGAQPADVFVIVGWTSLHRFEIDGNKWLQKQVPGINPATEISNCTIRSEYADYKTIFVNPSYHATMQNSKSFFSTEKDVVPFCVDYIWHDHMQNPQHEAQLLALHAFLISKGYRHIFVNTCGHREYKTLDTTIKNFYKLNTETFYEWAKINHVNEGRRNNHFNPVPHAAYGDLLVDYIVKNIIY